MRAALTSLDSRDRRALSALSAITESVFDCAKQVFGSNTRMAKEKNDFMETPCLTFLQSTTFLGSKAFRPARFISIRRLIGHNGGYAGFVPNSSETRSQCPPGKTWLLASRTNPA